MSTTNVSTSATPVTVQSAVPSSEMTLLFVEMGVGYDQHGQDVTKAAMKACRDAISSNSIPAFRREGANDIYKIAKARERRRRDLGNVRYIKDEGERTIVREEDIRKRWGEYFSSLFNESPSKESRPEGSGEVVSSSPHMHYDCYHSRINQGEVRAALQKMGRNKAVGPHPIPIEAWRLSEVIPIYKIKGDAQACSNYRGIKLLSHTMKLWERVIERRSLMKKYRERQRDLHMAFLDLEKVYDSIPQSAEGLNNRLESWRDALEDNGLRNHGRHDIKWSFYSRDVDSIIDKMREGRLRWFGHAKRRPQTAPVRRVEALLVDGSRRRGRPRLGWEDRLKQGMKELLLSEDMTSDRNAWRDIIRISG
ncbi:retrovirus-related pol polyprotein LINE-1 [Tanacetum coccineum]